MPRRLGRSSSLITRTRQGPATRTSRPGKQSASCGQARDVRDNIATDCDSHSNIEGAARAARLTGRRVSFTIREAEARERLGRLQSSVSLGSRRWVNRVQPPVRFVGRIIGPVVVDLRYWYHAGDPVIEHQGLAIDGDNGHCMFEPESRIPEDDQPEILVGNAESPQHQELGDGIVLALAVLVEKFERRLPVADLAPVFEGWHIGVAVERGVDPLELLAQGKIAQLAHEIRPLFRLAIRPHIIGADRNRIGALLLPARQYVTPLLELREGGRMYLAALEEAGRARSSNTRDNDLFGVRDFAICAENDCGDHQEVPEWRNHRAASFGSPAISEVETGGVASPDRSGFAVS